MASSNRIYIGRKKEDFLSTKYFTILNPVDLDVLALLYAVCCIRGCDFMTLGTSMCPGAFMHFI
jgi:hypothetical protein